jgi:O-antigen biosynthesis protein
VVDSVLEVLGRFTRLELIVAAVGLSLPVLVPLLVLAAVAADAPIVGLAIAAVVLVALACVTAVAARRRLRLRAALRAERLSAESAARRRQEWIHPSSGDQQALDVLRAATKRSRRVLHLFGVRTGSRWVRDVYASVLTRGRLDAAGLGAALVDAERAPLAAPVLAGIPDSHLIGYGRLLVAQETGPEDDAVRQAIQTRLLAGWSDLALENQEYLAEWLIASGRRNEAVPLVESWQGESLRARLLAADIANPHTGGAGSEPGWLAAVNAIFRPYGLDPVWLRSGTEPVFDRLETSSQDRVNGPLISVVMSSHCPDHSLLTAIRSMKRQTWQDWELLVVDDASPAAYGGILDEAAASDGRIRVLRATENGGTYVRRNDAIAAAHGEFITMHDSDDWAHPRRLELQAQHLLAHPHVPANMSWSLRVTEDLAFVQPRRTALRPAESSIMFRREPVVAKIGYYDAVRRGADSEYRLRLEAATGRNVPIVDTGGPLALIRYSTTSLSGSDFRDGSMHPGRVAYRSAMDHWHASIRARRAEPRVPHPLVERPFPASKHVLGLDPEPYAADVVIVLDVRAGANPDGLLDDVARELAAFVERGRSAALVHIDSLVEDRRLGIAPPALQQLVNSGRVARVDLAERVDAAVVVVRSASVLQGLPAQASGIRASRVVVVTDTRRDRAGETFAPVEVSTAAAALFGAPPEWRAADGPDVLDTVID